MFGRKKQVQTITWYLRLKDGRELSFFRRPHFGDDEPYQPLYEGSEADMGDSWSVDIEHNGEVGSFAKDPKNKDFRLVPKEIVEKIFYK